MNTPTYCVMIKNFVTGKYDILETNNPDGTKGLAVYKERKDAVFMYRLAKFMGRSSIKLKIVKREEK